MCSLVCLTSFTGMMLLKISMLLHIVVHSFLLLSGIPLYECLSIFFFFILLPGIVSSLGHL